MDLCNYGDLVWGSEFLASTYSYLRPLVSESRDQFNLSWRSWIVRFTSLWIRFSSLILLFYLILDGCMNHIEIFSTPWHMGWEHKSNDSNSIPFQDRLDLSARIPLWLFDSWSWDFVMLLRTNGSLFLLCISGSILVDPWKRVCLHHLHSPSHFTWPILRCSCLLSSLFCAKDS